MKIAITMQESSFSTDVPDSTAHSTFNKLVSLLLSSPNEAGETPNGITDETPKVSVKDSHKESGVAPILPSTCPPAQKSYGSSYSSYPVTHGSYASRDPDKDGYLGFLYLKCPKCGHVHAMCAKYPMMEFRCSECGTSTPLYHLTKIHMECRGCGRVWKYLTNAEDPYISHTCLNCGTTVHMEYESKEEGYVTVK